jgi:hypothetical protein
LEACLLPTLKIPVILIPLKAVDPSEIPGSTTGWTVVPSIAAAAIMGVPADITIAGIILATAGIMEAAVTIVTIMMTAIIAATTETILVQ